MVVLVANLFWDSSGLCSKRIILYNTIALKHFLYTGFTKTPFNRDIPIPNYQGTPAEQ
uniref:Uncharacterized protein n=1 Tax=Arundo donax TaxID=35708 RepID=A0A0A9AUH8_ARUDO